MTKNIGYVAIDKDTGITLDGIYALIKKKGECRENADSFSVPYEFHSVAPPDSVYLSAAPVGYLYEQDHPSVYLHPPAAKDIEGLMHELWAIAQGTATISDAVEIMIKAYEDHVNERN